MQQRPIHWQHSYYSEAEVSKVPHKPSLTALDAACTTDAPWRTPSRLSEVAVQVVRTQTRVAAQKEIAA